MKIDAQSVVIGAALLVILKYLVIGTDAWNSTLHPGRIEPASVRAFHAPLLTGAGDCQRCRAFWGQFGGGKG
jgi:hypothetical protein